VGRLWAIVKVGWGVKGKERGDAKTRSSAGQAVYVHYFKDIGQGALRERVPHAGNATMD